MRFHKMMLKFRHFNLKRLVFQPKILDIAMPYRVISTLCRLIIDPVKTKQGLPNLSGSKLRQMTKQKYFIEPWHKQTFCFDWIRDQITGASIRTVVAKWIDPDFNEDVAEGTREFPNSPSAPGSWRNDIFAEAVSWVTDFLSMLFNLRRMPFPSHLKITKWSVG